MPDLASIDRWLEQHLDASIAELSRLVAQPSVAAQGLRMEPCATLVAGAPMTIMRRKANLTRVERIIAMSPNPEGN